MKTLKALKQLALLVVAIFIGVHACSYDQFTDHAEINFSSHNALLSSNYSNPCDSAFHCPINMRKDTYIVRYITNKELPWLNDSCIIQIAYAYRICNKKLLFYQFVIAYDSVSCGFEISDSSFLAKYLEQNLKEIALREFYQKLDPYNGPPMLVETFQYICTKWCKIFVRTDTIIDIMIYGDSAIYDTVVILVPTTNKDPRSKFFMWTRINCGRGCCLKKSTFTVSPSGEVIITNTTTESVGDCHTGPINPDKVDYVPFNFISCTGKLVGQCENKCFY